MQKKKIIMLTALILIIVGIIALVLSKPKQMTPMNLTATAEFTTQIGETEYDITNLVLNANEILPTISAGMIPIKYENGTWTITTVNDTDWCDYANGKPAYIMLNDGYYKSELERGVTEEKLMQNKLGIGVPDDPNVEIHTRHNLYVHTTICI